MLRIKACGRALAVMPGARFDLAALRPPAPLPAGQTHHPGLQHPAWPALQGWCLAGAGPGTRPFWSPGSAPEIGARVAVASLAGIDLETQRALAHALCLERDGSLQLQACRTAFGRLQLRAATKLHDAMWWRARQSADAWDCGTVIDTPAGLQALARFVPRRATLVVADDMTEATLHPVIDGLQSRAPTFSQPIRLLVLRALPASKSSAGLLIDGSRSL